MRRHVGLLGAAGAARVGEVEVDADDQLAEALDRLAGRDAVERVTVEHGGVDRALDVDDRRLGRHGDGLFEGADAHVGVDRGREAGRQVDVLAPEGLEAGQREGDDVGARTQVDDLVLARAVAHDGPDFFDENAARRLDRHTGQHAARRIPDDAGDGALGVRHAGQHHQGGEGGQGHRRDSIPCHAISSSRFTPDRWFIKKHRAR